MGIDTRELFPKGAPSRSQIYRNFTNSVKLFSLAFNISSSLVLTVLFGSFIPTFSNNLLLESKVFKYICVCVYVCV